MRLAASLCASRMPAAQWNQLERLFAEALRHPTSGVSHGAAVARGFLGIRARFFQRRCDHHHRFDGLHLIQRREESVTRRKGMVRHAALMSDVVSIAIAGLKASSARFAASG